MSKATNITHLPVDVLNFIQNDLSFRDKLVLRITNKIFQKDLIAQKIKDKDLLVTSYKTPSNTLQYASYVALYTLYGNFVNKHKDTKELTGEDLNEFLSLLNKIVLSKQLVIKTKQRSAACALVIERHLDLFDDLTSEVTDITTELDDKVAVNIRNENGNTLYYLNVIFGKNGEVKINNAKKLLSMGANLKFENKYFQNGFFLTAINLYLVDHLRIELSHIKEIADEEKRVAIALENKDFKALEPFNTRKRPIASIVYLLSGDTNLQNMPKIVDKSISETEMVDEKNYNKTDLMYSIWKHNFKQAEDLINSGVDLNVLDQFCITPLNLAIYEGANEIAELLIEKGADLNLQCYDGFTPLHEAIYKDNTTIAKLLIDKNADLNVQDENGNTPLHQALEEKNDDGAELLIEKGADLDLQDNNGDTPLQLATEKGNTRITELLQMKWTDRVKKKENVICI